VALRAEDYSDFGSNLSGKLAARYDFTESFALRGSVQNGFRAPSLQQQYFATTATNFINGVPFDIATLPATDPVAEALGAKPLDAETSVNFSLGSVIRLSNVTITVDAYRIDIEDRTVLSESLTQVNVLTFEEGTPQDKYAAVVNWSLDRFGATARATRYGSVLDPGTTAALDVDLGAENVFDEYPDAFPITRNTTGNTPFSNYAPFGRSGRFIYGRVSIGF
jgi:outer membrane receptor protein involved in Fe transport